jgi:SAM-dependent methyltransferase
MMTDIQQAVRNRYGAVATAVARGSAAPCCGPLGCRRDDPITSHLYSEAETSGLPPAAVQASLGCGNPTALLALQPGQIVLDLGSGGGIDVLLSARRVGPTGKVFGLDMTDEMLALARDNQHQAGVTNVEFLKGTIEAIPLPASAVDVIISNCVINLSTDKDAVLQEAFRVLKPGGTFAVSDIVVLGNLPAEVRQNLELWGGCIAGALDADAYASKLRAVGFDDVEVDPWRVYRLEDARAFLSEAGVDATRLASEVDGKFASAFIRARKPIERSCCNPGCCG